MRNTINIMGYDQSFPYIVEYTSYDEVVSLNAVWANNADNIGLYKDDMQYYRNMNSWHNVSDIQNTHTDCIPASTKLSNIRIYVPTHSISSYTNGIKYGVNASTWVSGKKIDLGSFIFKQSETEAVSNVIKQGNNEYHECIDFDIIDVFDLLYADSWSAFRNIVCKEPLNTNSTTSALNISLFVVETDGNEYTMNNDFVGGITSFNISRPTDMLSLCLEFSQDPIGLKYNISMNATYDWLLDYLQETYGLKVSKSDIDLDLVIKTNDSVIPLFSDIMPKYDAVETYGKATQILPLNTILNSNARQFFESWNYFEEGWSFAGAITINNSGEELLNIVSNELPITQELYSNFINGGSEKIIDINDMNVITYNVVNKIENNIVHIDRPNESKANIVQPVFFKVKDTETLTLHPAVTETISINLDDYKSKVDKFTLQIEGCRFGQIGANSYGVLFKIDGNKLPLNAVSGTYYILDDNYELITTGKYSCIR